MYYADARLIPKRRTIDRLVVGLGALAGAFVGAIVAGAIWWNAPHDFLKPVQAVMTYREPPEPGVDASLRVIWFGKWEYTKYAPIPEDFKTEWMLLDLPNMAAPVAVVLLFAVLGGCGCARLIRPKRRRHQADTA